MFYVIVSLSGTFQDTNRMIKPSPLDIVQKKNYFYFEKFYNQVHYLIQSPKITQVIVVLKNDFNPVYFTALQEIKALLEKLTGTGKHVHFISTDYTYKAIYLGSVCTKRYIHELGCYSFLGFSINRIYFKKLMEKYNVFIEIYRRGLYKDGYTEFSMDSMDSYVKETYTELLQIMNQEFLDTVKANLHISDESLDELVKGKILFGEEAVQRQWVDAIGSIDDVINGIMEKEPGLKEYNFRNISKQFKKGKKKIALLFIEGVIEEGKSGFDFLAGKKAGTDSIIPVIQTLACDSSIHGVLLRINSPGGSGIAACDIAREVEKLQKKKPVVASIGNIGASGGYWIASPCKKIFVNTTSWVGSIGVISVFFAFKEFIENHHINFSSLKTGEYANLYSSFESRSAFAKEMIDIQIEYMYKKFIAAVSRNRNIPVDQVEKSARGRIWPGKTGKEMNLADACGTMDEALDYLKQELQVQNVQIDFYPRLRFRFFERILYNNLMAGTLAAGIFNEIPKISGLSRKSSISALAPEAFFFSLNDT